MSHRRKLHNQTIRKKFEIVNPSKKECTIKIPFGAEMQKVRQVENNKLYQIKKFAVDSVDFTKEINERIDISDNCLETAMHTALKYIPSGM